MSKADAYKLLVTELGEYRQLTYDELVELIGSPARRVVRTTNSTQYALETTVRWFNREGGDILVEGWIAVDDCGPLKRLDEQFVVHVAEGNR